MQVRPFPGLAAKEADTAYDGPQQPLGYILFISVVARVHGKHHGYRTHDEYKGHKAHKHKRQVMLAHKRERLKHLVGIGPYRAEKTRGAVRDKECAEGQCIRQKEEPGHHFPIAYIVWRASSAPYAGFFCCCNY